MAVAQKLLKKSAPEMPEWMIEQAREEADSFMPAGVGHFVPVEWIVKLRKHDASNAKKNRKPVSKSNGKPAASARDIADVKRLVEKYGRQKLYAMIRQAG